MIPDKMITQARLLLLTLTGSALLFATGANAANTLVLNIGDRHSGVGGEFNVYSSALNPSALGYTSQAMGNVGPGMGFSTFCLEYNEHFTPGGTYNYSISNAAFHGGIGGAGGSDPLSLGTAWLYLSFTQAALGGYTYTNNSAGNTSAGYLQDTIWWLEGEIASAGVGNPFAAAVVAQFGSAAAAMADNNGFFPVGVLNLTYLDGSLAQDQLILIPNGNVPEGGGTALLLGLGVLALMAVKRQLHLRTATAAAV